MVITAKVTTGPCFIDSRKMATPAELEEFVFLVMFINLSFCLNLSTCCKNAITESVTVTIRLSEPEPVFYLDPAEQI